MTFTKQYTEEQVEEAAKALAQLWGENWGCVCVEQKGELCDCGDAMPEERDDSWDERNSRSDCRAAARTVLESFFAFATNSDS